MHLSRPIRFLFTILLLTLLSGCADPGPLVKLDSGPTGFLRKSIIRDNKEREYALFLPANYPDNPTTKYPTIIFLHDFNRTGGDLSNGLDAGLAPFAALMEHSFPFIAILPHFPGGRNSDTNNIADVMAELEEVSKAYRVDTNRISLSGIGTGSQLAWTLAATHPDRFSALIPMASNSTNLALASALIHIPIRAYRSEDGDFVAGTHDRDMVQKINSLGGNAQFTATPTTGRDCWEYVFGSGETFTWLQKQHRH